MWRFNPAIWSLVALTMATGSAGADEIEDALNAALEAYRAGDVALAKEELDYAGQLIGQLKAEGLNGFLPAPLEGWTLEESGSQAVGAAIFGGGLTSEARYVRGGEDITLRLMADNPMVAAMATALGNTAIMGSMGTVKRIKRQSLVVTPQGEIQSLIAGRVMVQIEGSGSVEDKLFYFEALDIQGLRNF